MVDPMLDSPSGQAVLGLEGGHLPDDLKVLGHLCNDPLGKISTESGGSHGPAQDPCALGRDLDAAGQASPPNVVLREPGRVALALGVVQLALQQRPVEETPMLVRLGRQLRRAEDVSIVCKGQDRAVRELISETILSQIRP